MTSENKEAKALPLIATLKFATSLEVISDCIDVLESLIRNTWAEPLGKKSEEAMNVTLGFNEALGNALEHGNNLDPNKTVEIEIILTESLLSIVILDEGPGFDYQNIPDPFHPDNLLKECGRGVAFIRLCFDKVDFDINGTKIIMTKIKPV